MARLREFWSRKNPPMVPGTLPARQASPGDTASLPNGRVSTKAKKFCDAVSATSCARVSASSAPIGLAITLTMNGRADAGSGLWKSSIRLRVRFSTRPFLSGQVKSMTSPSMVSERNRSSMRSTGQGEKCRSIASDRNPVRDMR